MNEQLWACPECHHIFATPATEHEVLHGDESNVIPGEFCPQGCGSSAAEFADAKIVQTESWDAAEKVLNRGWTCSAEIRKQLERVGAE